ncbi:MAG: MmgE/PrpD family protein, partial [Thermodesulfobacteriota bacterium]
EVVDETKKFILDTIGVGLAGAKQPGCREVVDVAKTWSSNPAGSTIVFYNEKVAPHEAAFANSVLMHALDFDDTLDRSAMHTHVSSLPAALALAEVQKETSGKDLITAVCLGVDITCRIASAITTPLSWIRTATCGSFGAAAAAAKILHLDEKAILAALGVVYSQTAGNAQCLVDGGLVKRMQPGFSARSGVLSAALASRGVTGAVHIFEGDYGFYNLYERGKVNAEKVTEDLGTHFGVMDLSIKPYPCCRMTHAAIDAALELIDSHEIDPERIKEVNVSASKMVSDMVGAPFQIRENPQVDAQFSIPYTVAVALRNGSVLLSDFIPETITGSQSILELARKVNVIVDPALSDNDISSVNMSVTSLDGITFTHQLDALKGSPSKPLSFDECAVKFKNCLQYSGKSALIEKSGHMVDFIFNLDKKDDVREIFDYL